ncbi:MAG: hypothetical protein ACJATO_001369, partial [Arenicella sp.]
MLHLVFAKQQSPKSKPKQSFPVVVFSEVSDLPLLPIVKMGTLPI